MYVYKCFGLSFLVDLHFLILAHRDRLRTLLQAGHAPQRQLPSLGHGGAAAFIGHGHAEHVTAVHHSESETAQGVVWFDS